MSHELDVLAPIRAQLQDMRAARIRHGALVQDFPSQGCRESETFYGNLTQAQYDDLPLRTKRVGGPACAVRLLFEEDKKNKVYLVRVGMYETLYGDKTRFAVYVSKVELDELDIGY